MQDSHGLSMWNVYLAHESTVNGMVEGKQKYGEIKGQAGIKQRGR